MGEPKSCAASSTQLCPLASGWAPGGASSFVKTSQACPALRLNASALARERDESHPQSREEYAITARRRPPQWSGCVHCRLACHEIRAVNRNTFPATFKSMPKTRTFVVHLGFLVAGLGLSGVSTSAQFRQPTAELTPTVEQQATQPGQTVTLLLGVELPENIHVQSDKPRDPFVIPTLLTFTLPNGVTVEEITYPESTDFLLAGQEEPLAVFEHEFTIAVRLALDADVSPGEIVVPGSLLYQACDDRVCFAPATAAVEWHMHVEPAERR